MLHHGEGQQQCYEMAKDTTTANFMLGNCGDVKGHEGKRLETHKDARKIVGDVKEIVGDVREMIAIWRMKTMGGDVNEIMVDGEMAKDDLAHHSFVTPMFR